MEKSERDRDRELYRRAQRRGGRRSRFAFPANLQPLPEFALWIQEEVRGEQQRGLTVSPMVVDTARGPLQMAASYRSMYAFGNHYRVLSSELSLRTSDSGVAATFKQINRNRSGDNNQFEAEVEYIGHIEEILEINYRRHCLVVLVCDFVKAQYRGENATIKRDRWGFTLANYDQRYGSISWDSFAFSRHCEQVFYSDARESPGWRVVMRKEVRGKRVIPNEGSDHEAQLFQMGHDDDFEGLRPDRDVGEDEEEAADTGEEVILEPAIRANRGRRLARGNQTVRRGRMGNARGRGRGNPQPRRECNGRAPSAGVDLREEENVAQASEGSEDANIPSTSRPRRRRSSNAVPTTSRNIRQRQEVDEHNDNSETENESEIWTSDDTSSSEEASSSSADTDN